MSDATGRPLIIPTPLADNGIGPGSAGYSLFGSPVHVISGFPQIEPGAICLGFGDWEQAYLLVTRQSVQMTVDP
jgi:HK97 family phage major capsid protein